MSSMDPVVDDEEMVKGAEIVANESLDAVLLVLYHSNSECSGDTRMFGLLVVGKSSSLH